MPLLQRVFTRIGTSDSLESGGSTFACEMRETQYILASLGAPALVIVDELGRGTSNRDGASLAWAIAEALLSHPSTFTLFATHYLNLASLRELYRIAAGLDPGACATDASGCCTAQSH